VESHSLSGAYAHTGDTTVSGVLLLRDLCQMSLFPSSRDATGACANGLRNPHEERGGAMWEVISDTGWKAMTHWKTGEAHSWQRSSEQRGGAHHQLPEDMLWKVSNYVECDRRDKAWDRGYSCSMLGRRSPIGRREYIPRGMRVRVSVLVCFRAAWAGLRSPCRDEVAQRVRGHL
jgi:hypothetical protein